MIKFLLNMKQAKSIAIFGISKVNFPQDSHQGRQSYILWFLEPPANSLFVSTPKTYQFSAHAKENKLLQIEILQSAMSVHELSVHELLDTSSDFHVHAYKVAIHFTDYS